MSVFEITIQRREQDAWPVVVRHQPGAHALALWSRGRLELDLGDLDPLLPSQKEYGLRLGQALFREDIRDAFVRAEAKAKGADEPLRVLLIVEADDLRHLHWEQLHAPLDRGWDYLLLNQGTPFSLYLPSQIERRFPPIGRRDLRALVLVAGPEELEGDYRLAPFDVAATVGSVQDALGAIPCDVLAPVEGASGPPRLDVLCEQLTARADSEAHTLLHLVCHGAYQRATGETLLYFPQDEGLRPVPATDLIERLGRLGRLPHLTILSTCESADPRAEAGLGGLGQRLVRELGMPAVVAMTGRVSIGTAQALASAFYARLGEHGEVDRALGQALAGLQGRADVTVPALFSRLGGRSLWTDALDRPLTGSEIDDGLAQMEVLLDERAPVMKPEFEHLAARLRASLGADPAALCAEARREWEAALAAVNQLCSQALDLSFNALALGQPPPAYDGRCPFPGLLAFGARYLASGQEEHDDRAFFFGRGALIARLQEKLAEHNFLPVLGPSGSGKSSLVLAGLVPVLQKEEPQLQMAYLTPGDHPLAQLEAALEAAGREGNGTPLVLVVDQFEELFTLCTDEDERQAFLDRLLVLAGEMRVVIAMRADFWGDCAPYPALRAAMQARQELIAAMDASELRAAIEQQAAEVGLRFEADLSNTMVDAVMGEPGPMPLLQHALLELWNRRHGRWLMAEEYRDGIGGVQQAIAHTADALYRGLLPDEQVRMRDILLRLTRLGDEVVQGEERRDTRQRVRFEELVPAGSDPAPVRRLVQRLADARLVVTGLWTTPEEGQALDGGRVKVEVAHEALIRGWPRLRTWLDEDRAELRLREGVRQAALEWEASDRDEAYLVHRGGRLEDAEALRRELRFALNEREQAYVEACVDLRERERREKEEQQRQELEAARTSATRLKRLAVGLAAVFVLALAAAAAAGILGQRAAAQARVATSRQLAAQALMQLESRIDQSLLLSAHAYQLDPNLEARSVMLGAQAAVSVLATYLGSVGRTRSEVLSLAFNPAGTLLAAGSADGSIAVWDVASHSLLYPPMPGHADRVEHLAFSSDGSMLASAGADQALRVWSVTPGWSEIATLKGAGDVAALAFSPKGRTLASDEAGVVLLWDLNATVPISRTLTDSSEWGDLAFGADGTRLAVSDSFGFSLEIWDLDGDGQPVTVPTGEDNLSYEFLNTSVNVGYLDFHSVLSPDATRLAVAMSSPNGPSWIHFWDATSGKQIGDALPGEKPVTAMAFSPDGQLFAWLEADGRILVWDATSSQPLGEAIAGLEGWGGRLAVSSTGKLAASDGGGELVLLDLASARSTQFPNLPGSLVLLAPDARTAVLAEELPDRSGERLVMWDLSRNQALGPALTLHTGWAGELAFSPNGTALAEASREGTLLVWSVPDGKLLCDPFAVLGGGPARLAFGPGGPVLASSSSPVGGAALLLLDIHRCEPMSQQLGWQMGSLSSLAVSPTGVTVAFGDEEGVVSLWDLARSQSIGQPRRGHTDSVWCLAFSPDGQSLVSGSADMTLQFWDASTGQPVDGPLRRHTSPVMGLEFSSDGELLTSYGKDYQVLVWDVASRRVVGQLLPVESWIESLVFTPGGERLAWIEGADRLVEWVMAPNLWIERACRMANRNLSQEEWDQYLGAELPYRCTCPDLPPGGGTGLEACPGS